MNKNVCLIGNPNCGKTTLFNRLTKSNQKTGNWAGVTTESKLGAYAQDKRVNIIDLPGMYSLSAYSKDEQAVTDYLTKTPPDVIINVLDGTNLERNLYLTCQLLTLGVPVILAINFADELEKNGIKINTAFLQEIFGGKVFLISARKNINLKALIDYAIKINTKNTAKEGINKSFIEKNADKITTKYQTKAEIFTLKADKLLLNKYLGIPIFLAIMLFTYFASIKLGGIFSNVISNATQSFIDKIYRLLQSAGVSKWLMGLVCNGILKGLSAVLSFLPQILILYAILSVLEESGYSARVTFLFDRILRSFGLGGKSLISFTLSGGCSVTGVMATRTIENKNERVMTIFLTSFMPCGAKLAVFGWFSYVFFNGSALIATSMYLLSIICILLFAKLLRCFKPFNKSEGEFLMEMPPLRAPSIKNALVVIMQKIKEFLVKAGSVIFIVSVALWFLLNFGIHGYTFEKIEKSFLYQIGNAIKYLFYPIGVYSWESAVAIIAGALAKEGIIETLCLLSSDPFSLFSSVFSVYAFMAFALLSPPCVATLSACKKELNSNKPFISMILFQFFAGYTVAILINFLGNVYLYSTSLIFSIIIVIIIAIGLFISLASVKNDSACAVCKNCQKACRNKKCQTRKRNTTI